MKVAKGGNMVPAMIDTKLMTRETYTLYGIEGDFGNKDGKLTFAEKVCGVIFILTARSRWLSFA